MKILKKLFKCGLCKKIHLPVCPICKIRPVTHYPMACDDLDSSCYICRQNGKCWRCGHKLNEHRQLEFECDNSIKKGKNIYTCNCKYFMYNKDTEDPRSFDYSDV
jgi:hypothetical protein